MSESLNKEIQMTTEQKIKALAELDGWKDIQINPPYPPNSNERLVLGDEPIWSNGNIISYICDRHCKPYLTSYDAILPLIQKLCTRNQELKVQFLNTLRSSFRQPASDYDMMMATPEQLADALLRATGKWKE